MVKTAAQLKDDERMARLAERLDPCNGTPDKPICRKCGKPLGKDRIIDETGWYMRWVIYKCECGHWGKVAW